MGTESPVTGTGRIRYTKAKHGTFSRYTNQGCRCPRCTRANREHTRLVRDRYKEAGLLPDDPRHGKASTYTNYDCRCDRCRAAKAAKEKAWRTDRAEAARQRVMDAGGIS